MGRAQRKSRKKMNKVDGTALRDPTANAYREMPAYVEGDLHPIWYYCEMTMDVLPYSTHNRDPSTSDQETPKAVRELLKRIEEGKHKGKVIKRTFPKKQDKVTSELWICLLPYSYRILSGSLAAVGIQKRGRESIKQTIGRMHEKINTEVDEARIMVGYRISLFILRGYSGESRSGWKGFETNCKGIQGNGWNSEVREENAKQREGEETEEKWGIFRAKREHKLLKRKKEEEEKFGHARDKTMKRLQVRIILFSFCPFDQ